MDYIKNTGIYPFNHAVVIRNDVLDANPWLPEELFRCFKAAKEIYLKHLRAGAHLDHHDQEMVEIGKLVGGDPLPFGVEANRKAMETLIQFAVDQKVIPRKVKPEELFPASTLKLS